MFQTGRSQVIENLRKRLFSQKWRDLNEAFTLENYKYPGIYLFAYTKKPLAGKNVTAKDVFYVGMTNASLKKRLHQFKEGIEHNILHSGGKRFFKDYLKGVSYSKKRNKKNFFVAALGIRCKVKKDDRGPKDLIIMGNIAALEYYALGFCKERVDQEPLLNKK